MKTNRGIVKLVLLVIIGIVLLSYFGIDLEEAFKKPLLKENVQFTIQTLKTGWEKYIAGPLSNWFDKDEAENNTENTTGN